MKEVLNNALLFPALAALFLPLVGMCIFLIASFVSKKCYPALQTIFLSLSFISSIILLINHGLDPEMVAQTNYSWFRIGVKDFNAGILVTGTAAIMTLIVTLIATLVSLYSHVYMKGEDDLIRYFALLGFFTFSMLGIVLSDNLISIFIFWELVGFSSYALINHFYKLPQANSASMKAFLVNRIGDAGFLIGIAILWVIFGTVDLIRIESAMAETSIDGDLWIIGSTQLPAILLTIAGLGIFAGAVGKSAQFPLQVWLPDAMAGPTPVSALIHAATMVAAGVFLLSRVFPVLGWDVLQIIAITGAITAFMGAVAAMAQNDIKRVLAYSTVSQLGYMVMGLGTGAYDAALFHLFTHAFFKAGLFLAAGSVIYSLHSFEKKEGLHFDVQDMRQMGGLRKFMPVTFVAYTVLTMSLAGLPLFSGFLSKDAIILGAFAWAGDSFSWKHIVPLLGLITVALTAFYMIRQLILVFFGSFRVKENPMIEESPGTMRYILIFLALMSLAFVWSLNPLDPSGSWIVDALRPPSLVAPDIIEDAQVQLLSRSAELHSIVSVFSLLMISLGVFVGIRKFRIQGPYVSGYNEMHVPKSFPWGLSYHNWYLDSIYSNVIVLPVVKASGVLKKFDKRIIDRLIDFAGIAYVVIANILAWIDRNIIDGLVNLVGSVLRTAGSLMNGLARGNIQYFILVALLGAMLLIWLVN